MHKWSSKRIYGDLAHVPTYNFSFLLLKYFCVLKLYHEFSILCIAIFFSLFAISQITLGDFSILYWHLISINYAVIFVYLTVYVMLKLC